MDWNTLQKRVEEEYFDLLLGGYYINHIPDFRHLIGTGGSNNLSGYSDATMDEYLDAVMKQPTAEELRLSFKTFRTK